MNWRCKLPGALALLVALPLALQADEYYSASGNLGYLGLELLPGQWAAVEQVEGDVFPGNRHMLVQFAWKNEACTTRSFELMVYGSGFWNALPILSAAILETAGDQPAASLEHFYNEDLDLYYVRLHLAEPLQAGQVSPNLRIELDQASDLPLTLFLNVSDDGVNFGNLSQHGIQSFLPRPTLTDIQLSPDLVSLNCTGLVPGVDYRLEGLVDFQMQTWEPIVMLPPGDQLSLQLDLPRPAVSTLYRLVGVDEPDAD